MGGYSYKEQRDTYITTLKNDVVLKEYPKRLRKKYFDQYGAGNKVFKKWWDYVMFRLLLDFSLPFIAVVSDIVYPIKYTFSLLQHKKKSFPLKRLYLHHERRLLALSKSAGIQREDDVWFHNPFDFITLPDSYNSVSALDYLTYGEVWKSSIQSFLLHFKAVKKLGYNTLFLTLRAYEWCLTDFALRHIPTDVNMTYSSICDRMAIMYDKLPHKSKTMMQHGTMHFHNVNPESPYFTWHEDMKAYTWNSLYKSSPTIVYCYTKDDEDALKRSVIANAPQFVHMGYGFKPSFKPEKQSLLIVGNPSHNLAKEETLLKELSTLNVQIFLKNHPAEPNQMYDELRVRYVFTFIEGLDTKLPDVDLVISYDSTLAYEYASVGTKVLYYGHFDITNIRDIVTKEIGLVQ